MRSRALRWVCLTLLAAVPLVGAAGVTLKASPSRQSIYLGESFNLTVEVSGADRISAEPDFSELPEAEIELLGQHSNSRTSISIVNGRMSREVHEGRVFSYQIKPLTQGTFRAGPLHLTVKGKRYSASGGLIEVKGIEKQDTVVATVATSATTVLVEEPFEITVKVAVAELPEPYAANHEPLHPNFLPQLSADFLEIREDIKGLKGPDLNQFLNSLIDQSGQQPAFAINNYQTRDFGGFGSLFGDGDPFRARPIRFRLGAERVEINGKRYRQYALKLNYTATQEGEFIFGPLSFKGKVIGGVTDERQPMMRDIYTIGPAVTVRVVPPPDTGRPEWFIGCVGRDLEAVATLDTMVCKVGDPLTLTLTVTGAISISNLRAPLLSLQPELSTNFRIYDDNISTETLDNGKRFKYRVRPTRGGTLEFPPIKVAYFDSVSQAYQTVLTEAIPLQARATEQVATLDDGDGGGEGGLVATARPLPAAITVEVPGTAEGELLPRGVGVWLLLLVTPILSLLALLLRPLLRLFARVRSHQRRAAALSAAVAKLRGAQEAQVAADAVREYFANRFDVTGATVTPRDAGEIMYSRGVPRELAQELGRLLGELDEVIYRPDTLITLSAVTDRVAVVLGQCEAALKAATNSTDTLEEGSDG